MTKEEVERIKEELIDTHQILLFLDEKLHRCMERTTKALEIVKAKEKKDENCCQRCGTVQGMVE